MYSIRYTMYRTLRTLPKIFLKRPDVFTMLERQGCSDIILETLHFYTPTHDESVDFCTMKHYSIDIKVYCERSYSCI